MKSVGPVAITFIDTSHSGELATFAARCFHDTYASMCRASDVAAYMQEYLTEPAFRSALAADNSWVIKAAIGESWAGYAYCRLAALPRVSNPSPAFQSPTTPQTALEISRFYVAQAWHGRGVAQALLSSVLSLAASQRALSVWLTTWQENARAVAFYQKQGLEIIGTSTFLMGEHLQDDYVMLRRIDPGN